MNSKTESSELTDLTKSFIKKVLNQVEDKYIVIPKLEEINKEQFISSLLDTEKKLKNILLLDQAIIVFNKETEEDALLSCKKAVETLVNKQPEMYSKQSAQWKRLIKQLNSVQKLLKD